MIIQIRRKSEKPYHRSYTDREIQAGENLERYIIDLHANIERYIIDLHANIERNLTWRPKYYNGTQFRSGENLERYRSTC